MVSSPGLVAKGKPKLDLRRNRRQILSGRFPGSLGLPELEDIARFALQRLADFLERVESNALAAILLQTPKSRMANPGFLGQPIEGPVPLAQQFIDFYSD